ncbi:hypothetical protein QC758_19395, partial [Halomonas campisalis]
YAIDQEGNVTLTEAGAEHANAGNDLPPVEVMVTDGADRTASDDAALPETIAGPSIEVTASDDLLEGNAEEGDEVGTITDSSDPLGEGLTFAITDGSDPDGFFAIDETSGTVTLTQAGAGHVNEGGELPTIDVTAIDGAGRPAIDTAEIGTVGAPEIIGLGDVDITVDEANLPQGTNPDSAALTQLGSFTIIAASGVASLTFAGEGFSDTIAVDDLVGAEITTSKGVLEITDFTDNGDGTYAMAYSYTLTEVADHPEQGRDELEKDDITVTVTDNAGRDANDTLDVTIVDDIPVDNPDATAELSVLLSEVDGSFVNSDGDPVDAPVSSGEFAADWGADGPADDNAIQIQANGGALQSFAAGESELTINGTYGTLVVTDAGDGNFTYTYTLNPEAFEDLLDSDNPGETVTDVFTYVLTDADGDTVPTDLTFTTGAALFDFDGPIILGLTGDGGDATVYEAFLDGGTQEGPSGASVTDSGSFTIIAPAGVASLAFAGDGFSASFDIDQLNGASDSDPLTLDTAKGSLSITGFTDNGDGNYTVAYSYTLTEVADHPDQGRDELEKDAIGVTVTDNADQTAVDTLDVTIVDDIPVDNDDASDTLSVSVSEIDQSYVDGDGEPAAAPESSGAFDADWGADGPADTNAIQFQANGGALQGFGAGETELTLEGTYGTLVVTDNGDGNFSYTYTLNDDAGEALLDAEAPQDVFTYVLTDGDGDTVPTDLTFTITADLFEFDGPSIDGLLDAGDVTVDEANLANGTNPDEDALTQPGVFTVTAAAGVASLTFSGGGFSNASFDIDQLNGASESDPLILDTAKGSLSITGFTDNGDGSYTVNYSYTLTEVADHPDQGRDELEKDAINVTVEDLAGREASDNINVTILDDVPTVGVEGATSATLGGGEVTGTWESETGADVEGAKVEVQVGTETKLLTGNTDVEFETDEGTLTISSDGTWAFVPGTDLDAASSFSFTVIKTDGDG